MPILSYNQKHTETWKKIPCSGQKMTKYMKERIKSSREDMEMSGYVSGAVLGGIGAKTQPAL